MVVESGLVNASHPLHYIASTTPPKRPRKDVLIHPLRVRPLPREVHRFLNGICKCFKASTLACSASLTDRARSAMLV